MNTFRITWRFRFADGRTAATGHQTSINASDALNAGRAFVSDLKRQYGIKEADIIIQEIRPIGVVE